MTTPDPAVAPAPTGSAAVDPTLSFPAAYAELESILTALDANTLDVDAIAGHVARAHALVEHCRSKVTSARAQLKLFDAATGTATAVAG